MSEIPQQLLYTKTHEWIRREDDGSVVVGITDHAQAALGDMVFVELPEAGTQIQAGADLGVVESVKAASDVYAPLDGEVIEVNDGLADKPEVINTDPYGEGWFFRLMPADASDLDGMMNADDYSAFEDDD